MRIIKKHDDIDDHKTNNRAQSIMIIVSKDKMCCVAFANNDDRRI